MPTLPSPDTVLVEAADRLAAAAQRRGAPLPLVLAPLPLIDGAGYVLLVIASTPLADMNGLLPCLAVAAIAAMKIATGLGETRRRLADARIWSPELARRYRAEAVLTRELGTHRRYLNLVTMLTMAALALGLGLDGWPAGMVLGMSCLAVSASGWLADSYGECVLPRDPDLTAPRTAAADVR